MTLRSHWITLRYAFWLLRRNLWWRLCIEWERIKHSIERRTS